MHNFDIGSYIWSYVCNLGIILGALWLHFWCSETHLGAKGAPGAPQGAHPRNKLTLLETFWSSFFQYFPRFLLKRAVLKWVAFFLQFVGHPERSKGWAHMQSVRAGAVQTHFPVFTLVLKNRSQQISVGAHFGGNVHQKGLQQMVQQKGCPRKQVTMTKPRGSLTAPLACTVF